MNSVPNSEWCAMGDVKECERSIDLLAELESQENEEQLWEMIPLFHILAFG